MKLHKLRIIGLLSFFLIIGFTSCSDDDRGYWTNGKVNFTITAVTYDDGYFNNGLIVDNSYIRDLSNWRIERRHIGDWRILKGGDETFIDISNFRIYGNGWLLWFEIYADGNLVYEYKGSPIELLGDDPARIDDYESLDAAVKIVNRLMSNGDVEVIVRGETNLFNAAEPIYFDFYNAVDFYVR